MKKFLTLIAALIAGALSAQSETRHLVWDDVTPPGSVWWFNVYESYSMPPVWQWTASVVEPGFEVQITGPQRFFTVTAMTAQGEIPLIQHN